MAVEYITCVDCGVITERRNYNQIRCPTCAIEKRREVNRAYQRSRAPQKSLTMICPDCGREIPKTSSAQKRCPECARVESKKRTKERRQAYYEELKAAQTAVAVKKKMQSLSQTADAARKLGLTYGQYVSLQRTGGLQQYCRTRDVWAKGG